MAVFRGRPRTRTLMVAGGLLVLVWALAGLVRL
jgi:hypothetical protein